jgi:hypothetical protein
MPDGKGGGAAAGAGKGAVQSLQQRLYAVRQKQLLGLEGYEPKVVLSTATQYVKVEIRVWDNRTGLPESESPSLVFWPRLKN